MRGRGESVSTLVEMPRRHLENPNPDSDFGPRSGAGGPSPFAGCPYLTNWIHLCRIPPALVPAERFPHVPPLEQEKAKMKIQEILDAKGTHVVNVSSGATAMDALQLLVAHEIGSVVVLDGKEIVGILTERHLLSLASRGPEQLRTHFVSDIMTENPLVGIPSNDVDYVMDIMTENRVRHLPVVDGGTLVGIISIGDVVNAVRQAAEAENHHLRCYLQGEVR